MKLFTFKMGGVHPPGHKDETNVCPIETILPKEGEQMVFPMSQHIGAPAKPIVAVGERVLVGQKIAEATSAVSSPVHASVSGTVKEFRKTMMPSGATSDAIVIINDGLMEEIEMQGIEDYLSLSRDEYLAKIQDAGIVGLGGAGFPTHIKLNPGEGKKIDYIIVNAAECEPYLTTDHRVMLEQTENIVRGLQIMLKIFPQAKGIIGIETNKPDAIEIMNKATAGIDNTMVMPLVPKYPQGSEKQLIQACTGREVPSGKLPADVGCIVNNVDTVISIDRCIFRGRPLMRRVITLVGTPLNRQGNFKVRLGQSYASLIESVGGFKTQPKKMISGGPMMGVSLFDLNIPIVKTSSAMIAFTAEEAYVPEEEPCIRCGRCITNCPVGLMPLELSQASRRGDDERFLKYNGMDCIECGCCSYGCPAKIQLAQVIKTCRRSIMAERAKK